MPSRKNEVSMYFNKEKQIIIQQTGRNSIIKKNNKIHLKPIKFL